MMPTALRKVVLVGLVGGCEPVDEPRREEAIPVPVERSAESKPPSPEPVALPPIAKLLTAGLEQPGPYDEPRHSAGYEEGIEHIRVIELRGAIGELESLDWLGGTMTTSLWSVTQAIAEAADDPDVLGLIVRAHDVSLDIATAEELRRHFVAFKQQFDRSIQCHTQTADNALYYLLTACDQLALAPLGELGIPGPAMMPIHIKGMMDKLGIRADVVHIGDFKGAAEPFTRDAPSDATLQTFEAIVERSYQTLLDGIMEGRGLDRAAAQAAIDRGLWIGPEAVEARLVDTVAPWEDFVHRASGDVEWSRGRKEDSPIADFGAFQRFMGLSPPLRPAEPHVALIYAVGGVVDGEGGSMGAREEIASRTLVAALRAVADDQWIRAIVLRVSSPGGSALASEQIWHAIQEVKRNKPVIVSMGSMAASGGYYIATGADKIFANATTLTGSIGVVGGKLVVGPALESLGIKTYDVHRGQRALIGSMMAPWTPEERTMIRGLMERIYDRFVDHVAQGRRLERHVVEEIAQGRVWTGFDARNKGLVDEIGGLDDAIAQARRLGEVEAEVPLEIYPPAPTIRDLLARVGMVAMAPTLGSRAQTVVQQVAALAGDEHALAVGALLARLLDLREARGWAVSWLTPPR